MADAERHGPHVDVGEVAIEEVGHDLLLAGLEDLFGNLAAGLEALARQRHAAAAPGDFELELVLVLGARQHDEAALRTGDLERRVHDERQDLVEHAAGAERAQPFEKGGDLPQVAHRRRRVLVGRGRRLRRIVQEEHELGAAAASKADQIAVLQLVLGDAFAVDVRAVPRAAIAQQEAAVVERNLGVVARHIAANQLEIVPAAAPDREHGLVDVDYAPAEGVSYLEATFGHRFGSGPGKYSSVRPTSDDS